MEANPICIYFGIIMHWFIHIHIYLSFLIFIWTHSFHVYLFNKSIVHDAFSVCRALPELFRRHTHTERYTHTEIQKHTQRDTHRRAKTPICFSFDFILSITEYLRWNFLIFPDLFLRTLFYFISFYLFFQQFFVDGHNYFEVFLRYKNKDNITTDFFFYSLFFM